MQTKLSGWKRLTLLPLLAALLACQPQSPTTPTTGTGSLENLELPGQTRGPETSPSDTAVSNTAPLRVRNILRWEITPPGKTEPVSVLVGSVHVPFADDFQPAAAFLEQLQQVKAFYVESDTSQAANVATQALNSALNPQQNIRGDLNDAQWQKLVQRFTTLGLPEAAINGLKPWFINLMLGSSPDSSSKDPEKIMDIVLLRKAEAAKREIRFLEEPALVLEKMQGVSEAEHIRLMKAALDQSDSARLAEFTNLFDIYNRGDIQALETEESKARGDSAEFHARLVEDRNLAWGQLLMPVLKNEAVMVVVGSLHTVGPTGLVKQLEEAGFGVKAITDGK